LQIKDIGRPTIPNVDTFLLDWTHPTKFLEAASRFVTANLKAFLPWLQNVDETNYSICYQWAQVEKNGMLLFH
jgi:hypothetical protein